MIFLQNKYTKIYYNIINAARDRENFGYVEKHHIIPKSLGGDNSTNNIVQLTAREHFICHRILTKITHGADLKKMLHAQLIMTGKSHKNKRDFHITSRTYTHIKEEYNKVNPFKDSEFIKQNAMFHKGAVRPTKTREKMKNAWTIERRQLASEKYTGKRFGGWPKGKPKPHKTGENNSFYGKKHDLEFLKKRSDELKGIKPTFVDSKKLCEYCCREFNLGNYTQHHGEKCKMNR